MNETIRSYLGIGLVIFALIQPSLDFPSLSSLGLPNIFNGGSVDPTLPTDSRYKEMARPVSRELDSEAAAKFKAMATSFAKNIVADSNLIKSSGQLREAWIRMGQAMFHGQYKGRFPQSAGTVDEMIAAALGQKKEKDGWPNTPIKDAERGELSKMFASLASVL